MTIFGDGTQTRAFTYIDDVAPIMADTLETQSAWNQVFNIGSDRACSLNDLAHHVAAAMNMPPSVAHLPARHEVRHAYSAHDALDRVFGSRIQTPLEEGLRRMAQWVRQHGARQSGAFGGIEITKGLPASWVT
jgi:UDP-glucose 4-epimerase